MPQKSLPCTVAQVLRIEIKNYPSKVASHSESQFLVTVEKFLSCFFLSLLGSADWNFKIREGRRNSKANLQVSGRGWCETAFSTWADDPCYLEASNGGQLTPASRGMVPALPISVAETCLGVSVFASQTPGDSQQISQYFASVGLGFAKNFSRASTLQSIEILKALLLRLSLHTHIKGHC